MKTNLLTKSLALLSLAGLLLANVSCKPGEEGAKEATIEVKVTATTLESVTFEITTTDAEYVYYSVNKDGETPSSYKELAADNESPLSVTESGLAENTAYDLHAYAVNADGKKCNEKVVDFETSTKPSISIKIDERTSSSVKFTLTPVNAVSYAYAVAETSETGGAELTAVESSEEQQFEVKDLKDNTNYSIIATATSEDGIESQRMYQSFSTEAEPRMELAEMTPESDKVTFKMNIENVSSYAYAYTKKGEGEPAEDAYAKGSVLSTGSVTFTVTGLEPLTDYTLWYYGINATGYKGEVADLVFSTTEYVEKPFELNVTNICSTDADIEVTFDKDVYAGYWFVTGSNSFIMYDPETWDWDNAINNFLLPAKKYTENMTCRMRTWAFNEFSLEIGMTYYAGGVPFDTEGNLDLDAEIWVPINMPEPVFGESTVECTAEKVSSSMDQLTVNVSCQDADFDSYYISCKSGNVSNLGDNDLRSIIINRPSSKLSDTTFTGLSPDSEYTIVLIAKDKEGKLGNATYAVMSTSSIYDAGDAVVEASLNEAATTSAVFDITFGEGAESVMYYYEEAQYYDEETFLRNLKVNNYRYAEEGEFTISGLSSNTSYKVGFVALDDTGMPGEPVILDIKTEDYVYDGNQDADVEIIVESCEDNGFGAFSVKIKAVPNEYVGSYYMTIGYDGSWVTKESFVDYCLDGSGTYEEYTGETTLAGYDGEGEYAAPNSYVWLLVLDNGDKLVRFEEIQIEGTF